MSSLNIWYVDTGRNVVRLSVPGMSTPPLNSTCVWSERFAGSTGTLAIAVCPVAVPRIGIIIFYIEHRLGTL